MHIFFYNLLAWTIKNKKKYHFVYAHTKTIQNLRTPAFCVSILIMIGTKPRFCLWWLHLTGISSIILYPQCWEFWQKHENTIRWRRPRLASWQGKHLNLLLIEIEYSNNFKSYSLSFYCKPLKSVSSFPSKVSSWSRSSRLLSPAPRVRTYH